LFERERWSLSFQPGRRFDHGGNAEAPSGLLLLFHSGARWVGLPAAGGGLLRLDTATISVLGLEHGRRAIRRWNAPPVPGLF